jgi:hypothetical protein
VDHINNLHKEQLHVQARTLRRRAIVAALNDHSKNFLPPATVLPSGAASAFARALSESRRDSQLSSTGSRHRRHHVG